MISVTVITKNSEELLHKCLSALSQFKEIVVLDNGSTDKTIDIAQSFSNVCLYKSPFIGFGPLKNLAASHATSDWILSIDADEILTPEAMKSIQNLALDSKCVYAFDRENYFIGKKIKASGWSPDRVLRLYHRSQTRYSDALVHESVITKGQKVVRVKGAISHYSYRELDDLLVKMNRYSTLFAKDHAGKKGGSLWKALTHSWFAFVKTYILQRGFLDGKEGYIIARYNADVAYYKYLKLSYRKF